MKTFEDLFKIGIDIKARASLYCIGLLFVIGGANLICGFDTLNIYIIFQMMIVSVMISLVEYFLFLNYDELSHNKKTRNTFIWALFTNIMIIGCGWYFNWISHLPLFIMITLIIMFEIALIAFRYSLYIINIYETKDLNEKLKNYQKKG